VRQILQAENYLGRLIDYGVILPRAHALYVHAASELNEPRLLTMLRNGQPVYSWPDEERHVWTATRAPAAVRLLTRLTTSRENQTVAGRGRRKRGAGQAEPRRRSE
jgi:hypothetical protein